MENSLDPDRAERDPQRAAATPGSQPPGAAVATSLAEPRGVPVVAPRRRHRHFRYAQVLGGRFGYGALVVVALLCVALVVVAVVKSHGDSAAARQNAASYTPPPLPTVAPVVRPIISVVGDAFTAGSHDDSGTKAEWPALLDKAANAKVIRYASAGIGYVTRGPGGQTFRTEVALISPDSRIVVLFGGAADAVVAPLSVVSAATEAITAAKSRAPNARIVVIGPASSEVNPPKSLLGVRDALQSAARITKAEWVDPIGGKWLSSASGTIGRGGNPTDLGQKALEAQLVALLKPQL